MKIAIAGATGFIGRHLIARLRQEEIDYLVLSRDASAARRQLPDALDVIGWNPPNESPEASRLEGLDAVVNLSGQTVAQRWTAKAKKAIYDSRIESTRTLAQTLAGLESPPRVLVSHSAIGYYGARDDTRLGEDAGAGNDYLARLCQDWETAAQGGDPATRVVTPRVGIVIGPDGGALSLMLTPFRLGLGGPIGNGQQWMAWVHIEDVVGLILHAVHAPELEGPLNVTAPEPVRNRDFARTLGRVLGRPAFLPTPVAGLKLLYGEFAHILATGQRVVPNKALASGYAFRFPTLQAALAQVLGRN